MATVSVAPVVLKFGGSAFPDLSGYHQIADYLAGRASESSGLVVVVSAMSGTTGRLQETLRRVHPAPQPAVSAMMLTSGEQVSVALLTAALQARDVPARGLSANELGLISDGPADRARLRTIDPTALHGELARSPVLVIPGGQAVNEAGNLTMLGRNSSDLSAVAAAIAVGAEGCEIYSDVPGVCSADPYLVPGAQTLPLVGYATLQLLASSGAKVVQGEAVRWAEEHRIRIECNTLPPVTTRKTVIADAPPVAVLMLHEQGEVWSFATARQRIRAQLRAAAEGLDAVETEHRGRPTLVITGHGRNDLVEFCCQDGKPHRTLCLLTVLTATGGVDRLLIPREDSIAELRRWHDILYPPARTDRAFAAGKRRSEQSGLLISELPTRLR